MLKKILYFFIGISLLLGGTVEAVQISVPSASGSGFFLQSLNGGTYSPVSFTAGTNVTIATTSNNITISSSGGGASFAWPFTVQTGYNSTSTTIGFLNGLFSTASSTFSGNIFFPALSQGILYTGTNGKVGTAATSTFSLSGFTNDLASLSATNASLTFTGSYNGSAARTVGLNVGNTNTWSVLQNFNYSSTSLYASFLTASSTNFVGGGLGTCTGSNFLQYTAGGFFGCGTPAGAGTVTHVIAGAGFQNQGLDITGSGTLVGAFASSSNPSLSNLSYVSGVGDASNPIKLAFVATSSETCTSPISCTAHDVLTGGGAIILNTVPVSKGGTNVTSYPINSIITSDGAGTSLIATTSQLTTGTILATSTGGVATSTFIGAMNIGTVSGLGNMLRVTSYGTSTASITTGGTVNIRNPFDGAALVVYKTGSANDTGRAVVINQDSTTDPQDMILASSSCSNCTAMNLKGFPTGKGIVKIEHTGGGTGFSNSSALSIDLFNAADAQGIFVKGAVSGTGKLLNLVDSGSATLGFFDSTGLFSSTYSSSTAYSSFKTASTTNLIINGSSFNNLLGTGLSLVSGALTNAGVISLGNGTGTTCSGTNPGTCNVNSSQSISTLSNLSTNGLVTTSGSNGTLGITVNGTNGQVLAMSSGIPTWVATTTYGSGFATTTTNYLTHSTTTAAFDGVTFGMNIVPTGGALTWTPTFSGNFNSLSHDSSLTGTTYNLSAAVSDWGLALNHTNTWSVLQNFNYSSSTIYSSFITASSTFAQIGTLTLSTTTIGCLNTGSTGIVYAATCSTGGLSSYDAWTPHVTVGLSATTSALAISTTTNPSLYPVTAYSATLPQFALSAGAGLTQWTMRNAGGDLFIATTTVAGTATTSTAALTLQTAGKPGLGIGTSTPFATLSVNPVAGDFNAQFAVGSSTGQSFYIDNSGHIFAPNTSSSGASQTGYWCYDTNGQLIRDSAVCLVSARKFKKDITTLDVGLKDLLQMQPVSYFYKDSNFGTTRQMGFIADDVAKISPAMNEMLVNYDSNGDVHSFNYMQFTSLITKSIKEFYSEFQSLVARVSGLESKVNDQQKQIDELRAEIEALKK